MALKWANVFVFCKPAKAYSSIADISWSVWINDCMNGVGESPSQIPRQVLTAGWNWPCDISVEETSTPLPRDSYDTVRNHSLLMN